MRRTEDIFRRVHPLCIHGSRGHEVTLTYFHHIVPEGLTFPSSQIPHPALPLNYFLEREMRERERESTREPFDLHESWIIWIHCNL